MLIAQTTTTTTPSVSSSSVTHLSSNDWIVALALTVGLVIAAGIVVAVARGLLEGSGTAQPPSGAARKPDRTLIRSWLAISLAGGLLLFCAISFGLDDTTLRSTLIGGLVANAGAAVAFYFASKSSDQAREDILNASKPQASVPSLIGQTVAAANATIAASQFFLTLQPTHPRDEAVVITQKPLAHQQAAQGAEVTATFAGPVPPLRGKNLADATAALEAVGLTLNATPSSPSDQMTVGDQNPDPNSSAPPGGTVDATFA